MKRGCPYAETCNRIPYDRALEFANKEKITELLYPLFVHNIGTLLYHPTNQSRTSQVMAAAERRKHEQGQMRNGPGLPSMPQQGTPQQHPQQPPQQAHQPMGLPGPQPPLLHNSVSRPSLDRAHTFPTPPTSASSGVMPNMGSSDHFNWSAQGMNGSQGTYPMPLDSTASNTRSMPITPASTPPGSAVQSMQPYPPAAHSYDGSRQIYSAPASQQSPYQSTAAPPQDRMYSQNGQYPKTEMGPPSNRPSISGPSGDQQDHKSNGVLASEQGSQPHNGEEEGDHDHGQEYTHDSAAYDAQRNSYNYTAPGVAALAPDNNVQSELNGSPSHHPSSGRATPRTTASQQPYYPQHGGYNTPPRVQQSSSTLYNVMSNDRPPTNGAGGNDVYAPQGDMSQPMSNGYAPQPLMNGNNGSMKRGRDDEDEIPRPGSGGPGSMGAMDLKRRKTMMETSVPAPAYDAMNRPASAVTAPRRR